MKVLNWLVSGVLISLLIVLAGVLTNNMAYVGKANADDSDKSHHASIVKVERILAQTEFDVSQKRDLLRKTRIEFYLAEAKQADLRNWTFKRDDLIDKLELVSRVELQSLRASKLANSASFNLVLVSGLKPALGFQISSKAAKPVTSHIMHIVYHSIDSRYLM